MQKTRIGISVGLLGAAMYFVGLLGIIPVVLLAGYVLLFEDNEWLKRTAVKAVAVFAFFAILLALVTLVDNSRFLINNIAGIFNRNVNMMRFGSVISATRNIIAILRDLFILLLGFSALKQGTVKLGAVDSTINKHF